MTGASRKIASDMVVHTIPMSYEVLLTAAMKMHIEMLNSNIQHFKALCSEMKVGRGISPIDDQLASTINNHTATMNTFLTSLKANSEAFTLLSRSLRQKKEIAAQESRDMKTPKMPLGPPIFMESDDEDKGLWSTSLTHKTTQLNSTCKTIGSTYEPC